MVSVTFVVGVFVSLLEMLYRMGGKTLPLQMPESSKKVPSNSNSIGPHISFQIFLACSPRMKKNLQVHDGWMVSVLIIIHEHLAWP